MKTVVCIKHVPDTETKIRVGADGRSIDESQVNKWIISPYDEYALEQALKFREAGGGEVVLVCAGREAAQATLRQGLAMGADRAVLVQDERLEGGDALARARALAAVCRGESPDLVLAGKYGVGTDEGQTGPMLAELLGWPHASGALRLELGDGSFELQRAVEGGIEVQQGKLPAVVTCDKGLNEPRYPSLKGIMQAKKKPIEKKTAAELELDEAALAAEPQLVWESLELPPQRGAGRLIEGDPETAGRELIRILHEEAKVI
jgi:electron transfer flavoprotein beta subunit